MTPPVPPRQRPLPTRRRRQALIALVAAPLALLAITVMFRSGTPTAPLPDAANPVVRQQAAASPAPSAAEVAPPVPTVPSAPPNPETPEPPTSTSAAGPAVPELPPPATSQGSAPPASVASVPALAVTRPAQTVPATIAPNPVPAPDGPAPPTADAATTTWMRQEFGLFLDQAGSAVASLSEPQRDALFAEFMAWRRVRDSADHPQPPQPGPEDGKKADQP